MNTEVKKNGIVFSADQFRLTEFTQDQIIFLESLANNPNVASETPPLGLSKEKVQNAVAGRGTARSGR